MDTLSASSAQSRLQSYLNDQAVERLQRYFTTYAGREFERFGGRGDGETRDSLTSDDLIAVSLLNTPISPYACLQLLDPPDDLVSALLAQIPTDVQLANADWDTIAPWSPAAQLWQHLITIPGIGWVRASKLLARKRPHLIPVFDTVVKNAIDPRSSWWWFLWDALQDHSILDRLIRLRDDSQIEPDVSLIRVLDVSVWMSSQPDNP
jgi:hypothetical protein